VIYRGDVDQAMARVRGHVRHTPVLEAPGEARAAGAAADGDLVFKLEYMQHTGSFKVRGAFNRVLAAQGHGEIDPDVGLVVASGGNAGLGNAYAAAMLGVPAVVFVPDISPAVKVARLRSYGATVVVAGSEYATALAAADEHAARTGALVCHAYDQPEIAAGAGTLALELLEQATSPVDTLLVAVGGGGLMAGIAAALEGTGIRVVAVEPSAAPTLRTALDLGQPTDVAVGGVAADSLGARRAGEIAVAVAQRTGVDSILVDDDAIVAARSTLWDRWRIAVEHGTATAFAALTSGAYAPVEGERVAVVLSGANTSLTGL
jgi:threonine dehydratase